MATVAAVRALEQIDDADPHRRTVQESPRMTIQIVNVAAPAPAVTTIEAKPLPELEPAEPKRDAAGYLVDRDGNRIFDPYRNGGL